MASLLRHGLIRPSFVPPRAIRELRDLTRYRKKLLANGAAERNRVQKVLEDANIKLGSVLTDVFGASGQRMLSALTQRDSIDVEAVARLAHWRLQPKIQQIHKALEGRVTAHHRFLIQLSLDHMHYIEQQILRLDEEIVRRLAPYQKEYELLQTIPGIAQTSAASVLAEIGSDMSAFADGDHLASWTGICPGNNESAGKKFSGKTRKGNPNLMEHLVDCSWGATRKKNSRFKARYYSIKARRGSKRAAVAIAHTLLLTVFAVLKTGQPYQEPTPRPMSEAQRLHKAQRLCRQLQELGYDVMPKQKTKTA